MKNVVLPSRYAFFASFIICNAIIASVAIWNLGISQVIGHDMGVDAYLAFVSIVGLLACFTLAITELVRKDVFSARVWFECVWVGVFFLLEFSGAIATTALLPAAMCNVDAVSKMSNACVSTRVVLVFSWIITILTLMYLLLLGLTALLRSKHDKGVWTSTVHRYPWQEISGKLSPDTSPDLPRFRSDPYPVSLPKQRHPKPPFKPLSTKTSTFMSSQETIVEPTLHATPLPPPPRPMKQNLPMRQAVKPAAQSLYPQQVEENSSLPSRPPLPPHSGPSRPSPPPLGDWPRANIMNEPVRKKRTPALPALKPVDPPAQRSQLSAKSASAGSAVSPNPISQTTTPTHPRKPSGDWRSRVVVPPPLDLSKISTSRPRTTR